MIGAAPVFKCTLLHRTHICRIFTNAMADKWGNVVICDNPNRITSRKLPEGSQVSLETADNRMDIKAGRSRFKLPTLPRDDFPVIVEGDLPTSFELPAKTLAEMIDRTRFAISTEETRYYLNGIFLHVKTPRLRCMGRMYSSGFKALVTPTDIAS